MRPLELQTMTRFLDFESLWNKLRRLRATRCWISLDTGKRDQVAKTDDAHGIRSSVTYNREAHGKVSAPKNDPGGR